MHHDAKEPSASSGGSGSGSSGQTYRSSPKCMVRQKTVGSGENYGFIYGLEDTNKQHLFTTSNSNNHQRPETDSSQFTLKPNKYLQTGNIDPKFKAEAVIEVDQTRPFSIGSTKSAPDVIATH